MKKSIKLLVVILIISTLFVSFTNKVNAATSRDEWMTVSASNSKTYATGSMSCDPIYWGNVTTTIGYSTGYQTYYKSASVSAKSGTYQYVRPNFGTVKMVKSVGSLTDNNGKRHSLSTVWDY